MSAASEEPQRSAKVMTRMQQGVRIKESSWKEVFPKRLKQQKEEDRTEERCKKVEMYFATWTGVEHREEVHEKLHRRDIFFGIAQIEEVGDGGAVQQRG